MKLSLPPLKVRLRSVPSCWVAYKRATSTRDRIGATITAPEMLGPIYELGRRQSAHPGPPYARYLEWREGDCDLQIGVGLSKQVLAADGIFVDLYSACLAVVAEYAGPYDGLGSAHQACMDFNKKEGLKPGGACWEVYVTPGSDEVPPSTEVYYPVEP